MKSMKGLSNKMLGSIRRRADSSGDSASPPSASDSPVDLQGETPEVVATRSVKAFCSSGGHNDAGDEVTFLPSIVESAESSPTAAAECARTIRKYLKKDYWQRPSHQFNALMLMRILSDNPGPTFTRNLDGKFVDVIKDLLRNGRDLSVRQLLMETLDSYENQKGWDEGLGPLIELWKKEKDRAYKAYGGKPPPPPPRPQEIPTIQPAEVRSQNYFARSHNNKGLPSPDELTNRLEEARTSANLLSQLVANTPSTEVLDNDLIKEFADRCLSASRSIQCYMVAEDPSPDNETMEALIDVNEDLQHALNNEKRARLSARKEHGLGDRSENASPAPEVNDSTRPTMPQPSGPPPGGSFGGGGGYPRDSMLTVPRKQPSNSKGKGKQEYDSIDSPPPPAHLVAGLSHAADPALEGERRNGSGQLEQAGRGKAPAGSSFPSHTGPSSLNEQRLADQPLSLGLGEPTRSYLGRQDSAANKLTMHGAASAQEDGKEVMGGNGTYGANQTSSSRPRRVSEASDDIYSAPPPSETQGASSSSRNKLPVHRY